MKASEAARRLAQDGDRATADAVGRLARAKNIDSVAEALLLPLSDLRQGAQLRSSQEAIVLRAKLAACVSSEVLRAPPAAALLAQPSALNWLGSVREWARDSPLWQALRFGSVVELAGESGSGKTQLALQLAIDVQRAARGAEAAFVCTEAPFPSTRLRQLVCEAQKRDAAAGAAAIDYEKHVHVRNEVAAPRERTLGLFAETERLCKERAGAVKLVVIDSITALFRGEYVPAEARQRAAVLADIARVLHRLAAGGACVLVLNQVTDIVAGDASAGAQAAGTAEEQTMPVWSSREAAEEQASEEQAATAAGAWSVRRTAPAMSVVWAAAVNTRLMMSKALGTSSGGARIIQVVWCPTVAKGTWVRCIIDAEGVHPPETQ